MWRRSATKAREIAAVEAAMMQWPRHVPRLGRSWHCTASGHLRLIGRCGAQKLRRAEMENAGRAAR
jgi:hypothetical protein